MNQEQERLPVERLSSTSTFVLLDPDLKILSEQEDAKAAIKAFADYLSTNPQAHATVYKRTTTGWMKF